MRTAHKESHLLERDALTFSLADVIELARALHRLPDRLVGYGIEGAAFELGTGLSPQAAAAAESMTAHVLRELRSG